MVKATQRAGVLGCSILSLVVAFACHGCGSEETSEQGTDLPDAGSSTDAANADGAQVDAMPVPSGFGDLEGQCHRLDTELVSQSSHYFEVAIDFAAPFTESEQELLSTGALQLLNEGNAGGSSLFSEVFAFDVLSRCEGALLLKTETSIEYQDDGPITDFLAEFDDLKVGVSVTRAVGFPFDDPYPIDRAETLLRDKLGDVLESSDNVSTEDAWEKQILAILAYAPGHASTLQMALSTIEPELLADTIVYVVVTNGDDDFIYCDGVCP